MGLGEEQNRARRPDICRAVYKIVRVPVALPQIKLHLISLTCAGDDLRCGGDFTFPGRVNSRSLLRPLSRYTIMMTMMIVAQASRPRFLPLPHPPSPSMIPRAAQPWSCDRSSLRFPAAHLLSLSPAIDVDAALCCS